MSHPGDTESLSSTSSNHDNYWLDLRRRLQAAIDALGETFKPVQASLRRSMTTIDIMLRSESEYGDNDRDPNFLYDADAAAKEQEIDDADVNVSKTLSRLTMDDVKKGGWIISDRKWVDLKRDVDKAWIADPDRHKKLDKALDRELRSARIRGHDLPLNISTLAAHHSTETEGDIRTFISSIIISVFWICNSAGDELKASAEVMVPEDSTRARKITYIDAEKHFAVNGVADVVFFHSGVLDIQDAEYDGDDGSDNASEENYQDTDLGIIWIPSGGNAYLEVKTELLDKAIAQAIGQAIASYMLCSYLNESDTYWLSCSSLTTQRRPNKPSSIVFMVSTMEVWVFGVVQGMQAWRTEEVPLPIHPVGLEQLRDILKTIIVLSSKAFHDIKKWKMASPQNANEADEA